MIAYTYRNTSGYTLKLEINETEKSISYGYFIKCHSDIIIKTTYKNIEKLYKYYKNDLKYKVIE